MTKRLLLALIVSAFAVSAISSAVILHHSSETSIIQQTLVEEEAPCGPAFVFDDHCPEIIPFESKKNTQKVRRKKKRLVYPEMPVNLEVTGKILATEEAREMGKKEFKTKFNPGKAGLAKAQLKIKETDFGYIVQFPNKTFMSTPVVEDGKVYVSGGFNSHEYYCLDAETGKDLWAVRLSDDGPSAAVIDGDNLVFNTESCTIFALNKETGDHQWSWFLGDPLLTTPSVIDGKDLYLLSRTSGKPDLRRTASLTSFCMPGWKRWKDPLAGLAGW